MHNVTEKKCFRENKITVLIPLTDDKTLDWSKLKQTADDNLE